MQQARQVDGALTVAVTDPSGPVGRRLVDELVDDDTVARVIVLDVVPPLPPARPKVEPRYADVRDPGIRRDLDGVDVVVHLGAALDHSRDQAPAATAVEVVAEAARSAGVRTLVHVSTTAVYGAHPDNPLPIAEHHPLRPNTPFPDVEDAAAAEAWLAAWAGRQDEVGVAVLRLATVAGAGVDHFVARQLDAPRVVAVRGHRPPMQFVHVDDAAGATAHAIRHGLTGVFNVAATGWLSFDEVTAILGRRVLEVPEEVAFTLVDQLWRLGTGEPPGQVPYLMHPWVVGVDALTGAGWRPQHSNRDALADLAAEHTDRVVVGPLRARRSQVRAAGVASGVLAVAGAAVLLRRHRRARRA